MNSEQMKAWYKLMMNSNYGAIMVKPRQTGKSYYNKETIEKQLSYYEEYIRVKKVEERNKKIDDLLK